MKSWPAPNNERERGRQEALLRLLEIMEQLEAKPKRRRATGGLMEWMIDAGLIALEKWVDNHLTPKVLAVFEEAGRLFKGLRRK